MEPPFCVSTSADLKETENFLKIRRDMFSNLIDQAINNPANRMFATAEVNITGEGNLYGMVQCTPDLSPSQCQNCISSGVANFDTSVCPEGKRVKRLVTQAVTRGMNCLLFLKILQYNHQSWVKGPTIAPLVSFSFVN